MLAKKNDTKIIFDIDYREYNWKSEDEISIYYSMVAREADIIMGSREEFDLTEKLIQPGRTDEETAAAWHAYNAKIVVIKHGMKGSTAYTIDGQNFSIKPFPVNARKGFGGGDGYGSAFLYGIYQGWEVIDCLEFGSAEASMMVRSNSCSEELPNPQQVKDFIKETKEKYGEMIARVLAVLFLTKNEKMKSICSASGVSALLGITEPAMFGVTLKLKYPFYAAIIGSAVGNAYCAATGVLAQALGAAGLPGFLSMLPKDYLNFVIGLLLSMGVSAVLTAVFWKKFNVEGEDHKAETPVKEEVKEIEVQEPADPTEETNELYAPMKGEVLDVAKSADPAFASKAMGEGVAINPSEGIVYAPADGTISLIFPTKHAMGITLNSGVELLIHAGIDTVKMNGEGFETFVETGAKVKKGDKLLSFDMDLVKEKGYKIQTMFLVADAKGKEVEVVEVADADNNTKIMNLK